MPILLESGEILRGPRVLVPAGAEGEPVTPEKLEAWVRDGWVDLRLANCASWIERFRRIHEEVEAIPEHDTSSRYLRNRRFWNEDGDDPARQDRRLAALGRGEAAGGSKGNLTPDGAFPVSRRLSF